MKKISITESGTTIITPVKGTEVLIITNGEVEEKSESIVEDQEAEEVKLGE